MRGAPRRVKGVGDATHSSRRDPLNALPPWIPWVLVAIGSLGMIVRTLQFVKVTIPENFGSNPGFGAYESSCWPWWFALAVGVGLMTSFGVGAAMFVLGMFALGFVAQLLGHLFGN